MNLKFSFNGAPQQPHDHDDHAPAGASAGSLPLSASFTQGPATSSSVLEMNVTLAADEVVCTALSGDGVQYAAASVDINAQPLHQTLRSALARAGAELPEPLLSSVTAIVLDLGGREHETLTALGLTVSASATQLATVDDALQQRIGIAAGTPIRIAH